ncbi:unnamed protein product, partial [Ectocarpus fasciculatus]
GDGVGSNGAEHKAEEATVKKGQAEGDGSGGGVSGLAETAGGGQGGSIRSSAAMAVSTERTSDDDGNTTREVFDEEENELRRETAKLLHARAGARARVDANSATIFDITGE